MNKDSACCQTSLNFCSVIVINGKIDDGYNICCLLWKSVNPNCLFLNELSELFTRYANQYTVVAKYYFSAFPEK